MGRWSWAGALAILFFCGCIASPSVRDVEELAQAKRDDARLVQDLDQLEDRLLEDRARVSHWEILKERHASVSALTCENVEEHQASTARLQHLQQGKVAQKAHASVAQVDALEKRVR